MPGPDGFVELGTDGSFRRDPITTQGRVAYNAFRDNAQIAQRKDLAKKGLTLYGGSSEDASLSIYPGDLCFTTSGSTSMGMPRKRLYQTFVMSTLNQAFEKGESMDKVRASIRFAGVAGASGARLDCAYPEDDLAIVIGGLQTLQNTGPERINNGEFVVWDVPVPGMMPKNDMDRFVLVTRPYKPDHDENFRKEVGDMIARASNSKDHMTEVKKAALRLRHLLLASAITAFDSLLRMGFISADGIDAMLRVDDATRASNARNYDARSGATLSNLSGALGISTMLTSGTSAPSFASTYLESLTGSEGGKLDRENNADRTVSILETQRKNFISNLFLVVNAASDDVRSRVIGQALSPADPNGAFDCIMGHYSC